MTENDGIEAVLRGAGLSDRPWEYDSSIHSWRCEHPDRYGECSCFAELVADLHEAVGRALLDYADACDENATSPLTTWREVASDLREWVEQGQHVIPPAEETR